MNTTPESNDPHSRVEKLAYTAEEACEALGVSRVTLWRLEKRGLIKSVPHIRHKLYSVEMLKRFVNGDVGE